jgi:hypothetical protein
MKSPKRQLAQWVERFVYTEDVRGSSPLLPIYYYCQYFIYLYTSYKKVAMSSFILNLFFWSIQENVSP